MYESDYLIFEPFEHYRDDKSNSRPFGDTCDNILGLELELASVHDYSGLNEAIDDGYINTADTMNGAGVQLEEEAQSNVEYELVFNADTPENVLRRVREVKSYIGGTFSNHHECSAHIHLNREYLEGLGLSELDVFHAVEAIAPFIYAISGRDEYCWNRWTPCALSLDVYDDLERFKYIGETTTTTVRERTGDHPRYQLCNVTNEDTIEIRGFSNYYDVDLDLIEAYLDTAAILVPEIALNMQGRDYSKDYITVLKLLRDFIKDRPVLSNNSSLEKWLNIEDKIREQKRREYKAAIAAYEDSIRFLTLARENSGAPITAADFILRAFKSNSELVPHVANIDLNDINATIDAAEDAAQRIFKNRIWRV